MGDSEASEEVGRRRMDVYLAATVHLANVINVSQKPCEEVAITLLCRRGAGGLGTQFSIHYYKVDLVIHPRSV